MTQSNSDIAYYYNPHEPGGCKQDWDSYCQDGSKKYQFLRYRGVHITIQTTEGDVEVQN